ncbi:MAG: MFS transporter [Burkholderiales bacterium]
MKNASIPSDLVVIVAGIIAAMHVGKLPPALPELREAFAMSLVDAGFLLSIVQLAGMAAGILIGLFTDGLGSRRSILYGLVALSLASVASGFARELWQLMVLRAIEGLVFYVTILPVPRVLRAIVPPERLALKLGLWGAFMPIGTALALLCGPWVIGVAGWRGWWWLLAAITTAMAIGVAASVPRDAHGIAIAKAERAGVSRLRATLAARGPWLVALTFGAYSCQWMAIIGFLPTIYTQAGLTASVAGVLTAIVAAVNAIGNIAAGRLLHRGVRPERVLAAAFVAMIVCAIVAFGVPGPLWMRFFAVVLLSTSGGLIPGVLFSMAVEVAPGPQAVSTSVGLMQQLSCAGQFAGPPLVAWVAAATGGWQLTWTVTGGASLIGIALATALGRHRAART